jgi:hypothetical protein
MDLAHEVKEKISGHVTKRDITHAAKRVVDLKEKLASEQHELRKIQHAANSAENALDLTDYEDLKVIFNGKRLTHFETILY